MRGCPCARLCCCHICSTTYNWVLTVHPIYFKAIRQLRCCFSCQWMTSLSTKIEAKYKKVAAYLQKDLFHKTANFSHRELSSTVAASVCFVSFVSTRINELSNSFKKNTNYIRRAQRLILVILWLFWNTWIARNKGIGKRKGVLQTWAGNMAATDYIYILMTKPIFLELIKYFLYANSMRERPRKKQKKNISCKHFKNTKENK